MAQHSKGKRMTLPELLDEYNVEIPIIQRDYVQGRKNKDAETVRSKLLEDMKKAVLKITPPLDLNFVYGGTVGNVNIDSNDIGGSEKKFIPIDGQQRLTTLFLLYLYAFRNDASKTALLNRFTYRTRDTAHKFFKNIIKKRGAIFHKSKAFQKPSDFITDSSDYAVSCDYDTTVQSALVVLDMIAEKFEGIEKLDELLLNSAAPPITFIFLDIEELGLRDDLYIKLNARGKPLTDFENFKAKLLDRLQKLSSVKKLPFTVNDFERRFDGEWTDLFWKKSKISYEKEYCIFFKIMLVNCGLINRDEGFRASEMNYEKIGEDVFVSTYGLLNYLCKNPKKTASKWVMSALEKGTAQEYVKFHIVSVFLLNCGDRTNSQTMRDWLRVFGNLADNTAIDSGTARKAIEQINGFAADRNNLLNILENISNSDSIFNALSVFGKSQLEEEKIKAKVITEERRQDKGSDFENAIYDAEAFPFFGGQIRAGLYPAEDKEKPFGYDISVFRNHWRKIERLFGTYTSSEPLDKEMGILLRRALLSLGDYTYTVSSVYWTLCSDHTDAWGKVSLKTLFSENGDIAKALLEQMTDGGDVKEGLERIIGSNIERIMQNEWRYCLVRYPDLFGYMNPSYYRIRKNGEKILLVPNLSSNGYNTEIFTAALKEELAERGISSFFEKDKNNSEQGKTTAGRYFIVLSENDYTVEYFSGSFVIKNAAGQYVFGSRSKEPITETADHIEKSYKF